jgi:hypothetical protein
MMTKHTYIINKFLKFVCRNYTILALLLLNIFLLYRLNSKAVLNNQNIYKPKIKIDSIAGAKKYLTSKYTLFVFINNNNCGICNNVVLDELKSFKGNAYIFIEGRYDNNINPNKFSKNINIIKNDKKIFDYEIENPTLLLVHNSGKVLLSEIGDITESEKIGRFFQTANLIVL